MTGPPHLSGRERLFAHPPDPVSDDLKPDAIYAQALAEPYEGGHLPEVDRLHDERDREVTDDLRLAHPRYEFKIVYQPLVIAAAAYDGIGVSRRSVDPTYGVIVSLYATILSTPPRVCGSGR